MSHKNPADSRAKTAHDGSAPSLGGSGDRLKPHARPHTLGHQNRRGWECPRCWWRNDLWSISCFICGLRRLRSRL